MTVRTNAVQTCDRCMKPFNEKHLKAGQEVPTFRQKGLIVTTTSGTNKDEEPKLNVLFTFDDICPDCQSAVENLLDKVRLDTKPKKNKRAPAKKRGAKKDEAAAKTTTEYTEGGSEKAEEKATDEGGEKAEERAADEGGEKAEEKAPPHEDEDAPPPEEAEENSEPASDPEPEETKAEETADPEPDDAPDETTDENTDVAEASSDADGDGLIEDPATGDRYDPETGEVMKKGNKGESKKHPF